MKRYFLIAALVMLLEVVNLGRVNAQPKPGYAPSSTHIFPAGGQRGTSIQVRVGAECIPPGTDFSMTGNGVRAVGKLSKRLPLTGEPSPRRLPTETPITYPNEWQSLVKIPAAAQTGVTYWRLSCAQGGTQARPFIVGDHPEHIETESNSKPDRAESIKLPVTVNGQICGERDTDYYAFQAKRGEVVVCETLAGRIGSRLDPIVEFTDLAGTALPSQQILRGSDPVIALRVPQDGRYLVRISNVTVHGSLAHVYRMNLSTDPFIDYVFPSTGQAGVEARHQVYVMSGKSKSTRTTIPIAIPTDAVDTIHFDIGNSTGAISVSQCPNRNEVEPNDDLPQLIEVPARIHGRFSSGGDVDRFKFNARKGERFLIRCTRGFRDAPTSPIVRVLKLAVVIENSNKKATNTGKDKHLLRLRAIESPDNECRADWIAPIDGEFEVELKDIQHGVHGGDRFVYQLSIEKPQPDFQLAASVDSINVLQGKKFAIDISVQREGGFNGEIDLQVSGLPPSVTLEGLKITEGKKSTKLNFVASDDAPSASYPIQITGTAVIHGKAVVRNVRGKHLGVDSEGIAVGDSLIDQLHLTVQHKPLFRLFCSEAYMYAHRGSVYPYHMEIERLNGFDGPVTLERGDRQNRDMDGVEIWNATIAPGKTETHIPIYLPESMHINVQSQTQLYSQAFAKFKDKYNKQQAFLVLSEKRNMLRTLPPVVKLKAVTKQLVIDSQNVSRGQSVICHLKLERTTNFPGAMKLALLNAVSGVSLVSGAATADSTGEDKTLSIDAHQTDINVPLLVAPNAAARGRLRFRVTGNLNGHQIISEDLVDFVVR